MDVHLPEIRDGAKRGGRRKKPEAEEEEDPNLTEKQKERKQRKKERKKEREEREKATWRKSSSSCWILCSCFDDGSKCKWNVSITDGTLLPGYTERAGILGFDPGNNAGIGGFIFGQQRFNVFGQETGYNVAERLGSMILT